MLMYLLILLGIIMLLFFGIRWLFRFFNGYTKDNAYYDNTEIQYVNEGSYIKINKEWFKVLNYTSRFAATMTVYLEHEATKEQKEITVSPKLWVRYKVHQSM